MRQVFIVLGSLIVLLCLCAIQITAQTPSAVQPPTSQSPQAPTTRQSRIVNPWTSTNEPKPPDMVCFGYYPNWSVQFVNGAAHYLGVNEPDQWFNGHYYWVPDDKTWEWHRRDINPASSNGQNLWANIHSDSCRDPVRNQTFPYSVQVLMPQGDMVSGCCRKLQPGEAPVGPHGVPPSAAGLKTPTQTPVQAAPAPNSSSGQQTKVQEYP